MLRFTPVLVALLLIGCPVDVDDIVVTDQFTPEAAPVDVLFVVDNSNSMAEAQAAVAAAFGALSSGLSDVDWRVGLTTTDMSDPTLRGRMVVAADGDVWWDESDAAAFGAAVNSLGVEGSNLERGLEAAWAALSPPLASHDNAGFHREDARLAIVFVSDEDDCSDEGALVEQTPAACQTNVVDLVTTNEYLARLAELVPEPEDVALFALVETGVTAEFEGCGGSSPGSRYIAAARASAGDVAPLCGDISASLNSFGIQAVGLRRAVALSRTPDRGSILVETLGTGGEGAIGATIDPDPERLEGWSYEAESNTVRFWGTAQPGYGETIQIIYTVGAPTD